MIKPPPGFRFDPFADVRMGLSLFQMSDDDWLVPASADTHPKGGDANAAPFMSGAVAEGETPHD